MSRRAASIFVAISAIRKLIPWCIAIGCPNAPLLRVLARVLVGGAAQRRPRATRRAGRVPSRVSMATLKPSPSSPSRFAAGTRRPRSDVAGVGRALAHLVEVLLDDEAGGVGRDDERADALDAPGLGPSWRRRSNQAARPVRDERLRPVDHVLVAVPTRSSRSPPTSEPAFGSVRHEASRAIGSSNRVASQARFCSSLPAMISGAAAWPLASRSQSPIPEQPQFSSSETSGCRRPTEARPAVLDRDVEVGQPESCAFAKMSDGWVCCSSCSAAFGRISFSANSCASSRSARCSSVTQTRHRS